MADGLSSSQKSRMASQSLTESFAEFKDEDIFIAITGRGDTDGTVLVQNRPGYIYVRVPKTIVTGTLEEYSEAQAFSPKEHRNNMPVVVGRARDNPSRYEVIDTWPIATGSSSITAALSNIPLHHSSHELYSAVGGHDPTLLDTIQLRNLQVTPTSPASSKVLVGAGWYIWKDRQVHWFDEQEVDLADQVPSGTLALNYVSLWLEPNSQTITEMPSGTIDSIALHGPIEDLVNFPESDFVPLATVRLSAGNYNIGWTTNGTPNFIDLRPHQSLMPGDMLPAGHPLDPEGGYHTGTLDAEDVVIEDVGDFYASGTVEGALSEIGSSIFQPGLFVERAGDIMTGDLLFHSGTLEVASIDVAAGAAVFNKQGAAVDALRVEGGSEDKLLLVAGASDEVRQGDGDTNYAVTDKAGDSWWVGGGGLIFGSMCVPGVDIVVSTGDANPHEVKNATDDGWAVGELNLVTFPTGGTEHYLTVPKVGRYEVIWDLSGHTGSGGGTTIHGGVMVDGAAISNEGEAHGSVTNSNVVVNISSVNIVDCPDGTEQISLYVAVTNSTDFHVEHGNVKIMLIGGTAPTPAGTATPIGLLLALTQDP